ncbi:MAG: TIGR00269 family protein [Thaumarchaeota archaeon]|nr:TIGR00269 family protein [Nitrososphaerota archaeon]
MNERPCSKCGKGAVYGRRYSGVKLCSPCYSHSIIEKTRRTISKFGMLEYGTKMAVGVSGGKDSLSLLHVLSKIVIPHGSELFAVTVDEGVEGYRDEAIQNAIELSSRLGVKQITVSFKELFGTGLDDVLEKRKGKRIASCTVCGTFRRRALEIGAQKVGADVIATGHNLDDFLQTFLMNLFSGDVERIRWMDPAIKHNTDFAFRRIKPFMEIYEEEIAFYAFTNNLPLQSETCPHMNESIRSEMREILNKLERAHPGMKYIGLRSVLKVASNIENVQQREINLCAECGFPTSGVVCSVCQMRNVVSDWQRIDLVERSREGKSH